ncbi:hypothetical protein AVEN_217337-1 [Araneus ventricosus]|uniref:Uncharacterized protein n=1 Tax=Araneus ventricosus TaxID=182803 RepID=A0A4Y2JU56_ARAVE|nr:hypothetical protein AVEN_217337-1 [Araneus ventricosus]
MSKRCSTASTRWRSLAPYGLLPLTQRRKRPYSSKKDVTANQLMFFDDDFLKEKEARYLGFVLDRTSPQDPVPDAFTATNEVLYSQAYKQSKKDAASGEKHQSVAVTIHCPLLFMVGGATRAIRVFPMMPLSLLLLCTCLVLLFSVLRLVPFNVLCRGT